MITKNETPSYVVDSDEENTKHDESIALLKLVTFARQDVIEKRITSIDSFKERLNNYKLSLKGSTHIDGKVSKS